MKFLVTRCALDIGLLAVLIAVCFDAMAADPRCITDTQLQSLKERVEGLAPHVDKARIFTDYVASSRLLSERLARVQDCQQDATYLDNVLNSCRPLVLEYNSQVEVHNAILRRLETAKILQADFIEMKRLLTLPRCGQ